jgi:hypothetical protein
LYSFPEEENIKIVIFSDTKPATQFKIAAAKTLKTLVTNPINLTDHNNASMPKTKQTFPFALLDAVINNQDHKRERLITDQVHWL